MISKIDQEVKYDVISSAIAKVKDIRFLKVGLSGNDKVCISRIGVILNNDAVFSNAGQCLDNNKSFTINANQLRADANWKYNAQNN